MNELAKKLMCILMRGGVEIWTEEKRIETLKETLPRLKEHKFVGIDNELVNTADIIGIFSAQTMEDKTRRKNGMWKCRWGYWHNKGETCAHNELERFK